MQNLKLTLRVCRADSSQISADLKDVASSFAGLQILYTLLQNVSAEEAAAQSFYQTYFCDILQHIFSVVTDTSHTAGKEIMNVSSHNYKGFSV